MDLNDERARHAIGGVVPARVERPATREEAERVLREAAHDGLAVVPWGGGITLTRETAPERYDLALDLGALTRVVQHEPDDFTITVEAGITRGSQRRALWMRHAPRITWNMSLR